MIAAVVRLPIDAKRMADEEIALHVQFAAKGLVQLQRVPKINAFECDLRVGARQRHA